MSGKVNRDIRDRILKASQSITNNTPKVNVGAYAGNVAKSLMYSGRDAVTKTLLPNLFETVELNKSVVSDVVDAVRNPRAFGSKYKILDEKAMDELAALRKNVLDDLKTGKFYDPARDRSNFGIETAKLLDEFGGVDMSGFDDDGEYSEPTDTDEIISSQREIAVAQEEGSDIRTRMTISAMGQSTDAIITSQENIHRADVKVRMAQHSQTMTGIGNLLTTNAAMYEAQISAFNSMTSQIVTFSETVNSKMDSMISILTEIRDANGGASQAEKKGMRYTGTPSDTRSPLTSKGLLDIRKYAQSVVKQTDDTFGISTVLSMVTGGMSASELIDMYKSNPLQFLMDRAITTLIPTTTKEISKQLNKSIGGFFSSLLLKINNSKDKEGIWGLVGKMFGADISSRTSVELADYNKGEIALNGKIEKSVTEVIPGLLRIIAEGVTGKKVNPFNYETGKTENPFDKLEEYNRQMNDLTRHMTETMSYFDKRIASMQFTSEGSSMFKNDLKNYIQATASKGIFLSPNTSARDLGLTMESPQSEALIKAMIKRMPRSTIQNANREIANSHRSRDEATFRANKDIQETGMSALYNGQESDYSNYADDLKAGKRVRSEEYIKEMNKNMSGVNKTNDILEKILGTLNRGLVVFPNSSKKGGTASPAELKALRESGKYMSAYESRKQTERDELLYKNRNHEEFVRNSEHLLLGEGREYFDHKGGVVNEKLLSDYFGRVDADVHAKEKKAEQEKRDSSKAYTFLKGKFGKTGDNGKNIIDSLRDAINNPFKLVNQAMKSIDRGLFKVIYGDEAESFISDDEFETYQKTGLFGHIASMFTGSMSKITQSFKDALWSDESLLRRNYIKGRDWVEGKVKGAGMKGFKYFADPMSDTFKNSDTIDEMIAQGIDPGLNLRQKIGYEAKKLKQKAGLNFNKNFIGDMKDSWKDRANMGDRTDLNLAQKIGMKTGNFVDKTLNTIQRVFLGDDVIDENGNVVETESKKLWKNVSKEFAGFLPKGIVYGAAGAGTAAGLGLLTGLFIPGGPIMGAMIGSTVGFISHSENFRKYLFGDEENDKPGVINKKVVDGFKKYFPKVAGGMVAGAVGAQGLGMLTSLYLPGGPLMGALVGGISGMVAANDELKKLLFGDAADPDSGLMSKNLRKDVLERLGLGFLGYAGAGMALSHLGILGSIALPGGPLLAPMVAGVGAAFSKDAVKNFFFGSDETDEKGEKVHKGIFASMWGFGKKEFFDPFIGWINKSGDSIDKWFQTSIMDNLREGMQPFKEEMSKSKKKIGEAIGNMGAYMKDGINNAFANFLGKPLGEALKEKVTDPLKSLLGTLMKGIGSFAGAIVSSPFRLINAIGTGRPMFADDRAKLRYERRQKNKDLRSLRAQEKEAKNALKAKDRDARRAKLAMAMNPLWSFMYGDSIGKSSSPLEAGQEAFDSAITVGSPDDTINPALLPKQMQGPVETDTQRILRERNLKREKKNADREKKRNDKATKRQAKLDARAERDRKDREFLENRIANRELRREESFNKRFDPNNKDSKKEAAEDNFYQTNKFRRTLMNIDKNTEALRHEIKGQVNGVGYNLAFIRNILIKQFGHPGVEPNAATERKGYNKPRGWFSNTFGGLGRKISNKLNDMKEDTKGFLIERFGWIAKPTRFVKSIFSNLGNMIGDGIFAAKSAVKFVGKLSIELAKAMGPALVGAFKDVLEGVGTIFKGSLQMIADLGVTATNAIKGFGESLGTITSQIATSFGDVLNVLTSGAKAFAVTAFELLSTVGVDIAKGIWSGIKNIGGLGLRGVGAAASRLINGPEKVKTKKKYLGQVYVTGGSLGLEGIKLRDSGGMLAELNMVRLLGGRVIGRVDKAMPVYIVNSVLKTSDRGAREHMTDNIAGEVIGDSINDRIDENESGSPAGGAPKGPKKPKKVYWSNFKERYKESYDKVKSASDFDKASRNVINNIKDDEGFVATDTLLQREQASSLDRISNALGAGSSKGSSAVGAGLLQTLGGLGSLIAGLIPIGGSIVSLLGGNWERLGINILKKSPMLRNSLKGVLKSSWKFLATTTLGKTTGSVTRRVASKLGLGTIEHLGREKLTQMALETIEKNAVSKAMTQGAKKELAEKLAKEALQKGGGKVTVMSFKNMADASLKTLKDTKLGKITANAVKSSIGKTAVAESVEAVNNSAFKQVMGRFKSTLLNSKILQKIGGSKMGTAIAKCADEIGAHLAKSALKDFTKGFAAKVIQKLGGIPFLLYDLTTGMAEAKNIFKVSGDVTWKMRVAAGLAKMVSGIFFGLLSDSFLVEIFYKNFASEAEMNKIHDMQTALKDEASAYNAENGTNYTVEQYNNKVANKRVMTKVTDTVKAAWTGITGTGNGTASDVIANGFKGLQATLEKMNFLLDTWLGQPAVDTNRTRVYGKGVTVDAVSATRPQPINANIINGLKRSDASKISNGLMLFTQDDNRWANVKYGQSTMKDAGCAPTIAASLIGNFLPNKQVSPVEAAAFAEKNGYKLKNNGTDIKFFAAYAKQFGIRVVQGIKHPDTIISQIRSNRPVIVMGRKISKDSAYSGAEMHYMMLTGYDENSKMVAIMDPASPGIRYNKIGNILKDTSAVLFTDIAGRGMASKFIPDKKLNNSAIAGGTPTLFGSVRAKVGSIAKSTKDFIDKVVPGAISGFNQYRVLPSLTIAQAILESGSGRASIGNNIFGIKANSTWEGLKQWVMTSEWFGGKKRKVPAPFRDYASIDESILDHSKLLTNKRYKNVLAARNYKEAAIAVQKAGYATDPDYASKLVNIIERYNLDKYDNPLKGYGATMSIDGGVGNTYLTPKQIDGMYYYAQNNLPGTWKAVAYSKLAINGCGPTVAAMVISSYGKKLNPLEAEQLAINNKYKRSDGGTDIAFFPFIGKRFGLKFIIGIKSEDKIIKALLEDKPIILMGQASISSKNESNQFNSKKIVKRSPWPNTMHYIILSSYNGTDKTVQVIDPLNTKSGRYSLKSVLEDTKQVIYTSDASGRGISRDKNIKDISAFYTKEREAGVYNGQETADNGSIVSKVMKAMFGSDGDDESDQISIGSNPLTDPLSILNKLFNSMDAFRRFKQGSMTWDQAYQEVNGMTDEDMKSYKDITIPGNGIAGATYKGSKYVTGDTDIHDFFGKRLEALAKDYYNKKGPLVINSGMRTLDEQIALWDARDRKFDKVSNGNITNAYVANPYTGFSYHRFGMAADVGGWAKAIKNSVLKKYGLIKPLGNEPWHVSPIEIKDYASSREMAAKYGYPGSDLATQAAAVKAAKNTPGATSGTGDANTDSLYESAKKINTRISAARQAEIQRQTIARAEEMSRSIASASGSSSGANDTMVAVMNAMLKALDGITKVLERIEENTSQPAVVAVPHADTRPVSKNTNGKSIVPVKSGDTIIDAISKL